MNQYDDNRTLAKAHVRMHSWVEQLISFKLDKQSISSASVDNAIRYLLDPINNFTILSENHRKQICKALLQKPYDPTKFNEYLVDYFNAIDIPIKHPYNKNLVISLLCYQIKDEWQNASAKNDTCFEVENLEKILKYKKQIIL